MQNDVHSLNLYKKSLQWRPRTVDNKQLSEVLADENVESDFSDLLYELRADLKLLKEDENRIRSEVDRTLIDAEKKLGENDFLRIFDQSMARFNAELDTSEAEVRQLAMSLKGIYVLADNISGRVSALDTARTRVVDCLQRVSDLRDFRTCAEGVQASMAQEEYDEAARHIHRFFALDSAVFKMGEQLDADDSHHSVKQCYEILRTAAAELKVIVEHKFDEARATDDVASMERFFKIFPLINEHTSGLCRYAEHLSSKIATIGDDNFKILQAGGTDDKRKNVMFADALRMIFEGIARLIDIHQQLIGAFYGADKLLLLFELIQPECDKQSLRVVNAFVQKRQIEYKSKQVDAYLRNAGIPSADDKMDALELDVLLSEITLMHTHAELYWRFLKRRVEDAPPRPLTETAQMSEEGNNEDTKKAATVGKSPPLSPALKELPEVEFFERTSENVDNNKNNGLRDEKNSRNSRTTEQIAEHRKRCEERNQKLDVLLHRTALNLKMQEILGKYVQMEQYYMIETVKKAIEMDDVEPESLTSTLLDDVFFIVRKSIRRSISSSSVDCVCAVLNNGVTLLETEFVKHINASIRAGYPSAGWTAEAYQTAAQTAQSAYHQVIQPTAAKIVGGGSTVMLEKDAGSSSNATERQKSAFLIALNNLRASMECVSTLRAELDGDFKHHLVQISDLEKSKLENSVGQLDDLCKKLEYHVNLGISKLCEAAFRPKLKTNAEEYLDISHTLTEDELANYEAVDPFVETFISQLDKQIASFESLLLPENYQALILEASVETLRQFERVVRKCAFNRLGALQLDKEFRHLTTYLTSIAGWTVREKCAYFAQIVALLNSESFDEATDFLQQQASGGTQLLSSERQLTLDQVQKLLALRVDYPSEKIKQLRF